MGLGAHIKDCARRTFSNWRALYFFPWRRRVPAALSSANVASLVLARALARQREFAIRGALGGEAARLARQLIVEGALLAVPGAGVGLVLTIWLTGILPSWLPSDYLPRRVDRHRSAGLRLHAADVGLHRARVRSQRRGIRHAPRFVVGPRPGLTVDDRIATPAARRYALVVGEITMALVLLFGAGLFPAASSV